MVVGSGEHQQSSDAPDEQADLVGFANIEPSYCCCMRVILIGRIDNAEEGAGGSEGDDFPSDGL
jgi:hypothetical protein